MVPKAKAPFNKRRCEFPQTFAGRNAQAAFLKLLFLLRNAVMGRPSMLREGGLKVCYGGKNLRVGAN